MKPVAPRTELSPSSLLRKARKPLTLIAALGLLALGNDFANANDLVNANLDVGAISSQNLPTPTGWIVDASQPTAGVQFDGCSSEGFCNVANPGGKGLFFKPFTGVASDPVTVHFYQDNPSTAGTKYTLSGYAAGEGNYCGFFNTNSPAPATLFVVVFLNGGGTVLASNVLDLVAAGLPNTGAGPSSMVLLTTPQVTAPAGTVTVRAGVSMINGYGTSGGQAFVVDAFDLTSVAPPGAPNITNQPVNQSVSAGVNATFTVGVSNPAGVAYQWQFNQTDISDGGNLSGTTTKTLTITGVSAADVGHYRVRLTNGGGTVLSTDGTLAIVGINFYPVVTIDGKIGDTYRVDYSTALAPTTWIPLSTNLLTMSPQLVLDASSPGSNTRFYQAVYVLP